MVPDSRERRWAERLVEVQNAKNDLIRLLGLINVLNGVSAREASLEAATHAMARHLTKHLDLKQCLFFLNQEPGPRLIASFGEGDHTKIAPAMEIKLGQGSSYASQIEVDGTTHPVHCLPVSSGGVRLGTMVLVLKQELDFKGKRELHLVSDAVTPVLETLLLRNQVHEINQQLRHALRRSSQNFEKAQEEKQRAQACVDTLMESINGAYFITDLEGHLIRFNLGLERLLGWDRHHLYSKSLDRFFSAESEWNRLSEQSCRTPGSGTQDTVELVVQAGHILRAELDLIPLFCEQECTGFMGRFQPSFNEEELRGGVLSAEESLSLAELTEEVVNDLNDLLMALQSNIQLLLHHELSEEVRDRLELLENMSMDGAGVVRKVQINVDQIRAKCRKAAALTTLWGDTPPGGSLNSD